MIVATACMMGCSVSNPLGPVRTQASADMKCAPAQLTTTPPSPAANPFVFTVEGCGEIGWYHGFCNAYGCDVTGGVVSTLVRAQAAFDLQCSAAAITLQPLNEDTYGARGCDRQQSYLIRHCHRPQGAPLQCEVVQNAAPPR
jgi:hypothetical protein